MSSCTPNAPCCSPEPPSPLPPPPPIATHIHPAALLPPLLPLPLPCRPCSPLWHSCHTPAIPLPHTACMSVAPWLCPDHLDCPPVTLTARLPPLPHLGPFLNASLPHPYHDPTAPPQHPCHPYRAPAAALPLPLPPMLLLLYPCHTPVASLMHSYFTRPHPYRTSTAPPSATLPYP